MQYTDLILLELSSDGIRTLAGGLSVRGRIELHYKNFIPFHALDRKGIVSDTTLIKKIKESITLTEEKLEIKSYQFIILFKDFKSKLDVFESSFQLKSEILATDKFEKFLAEINKLKPKYASDLFNDFFLDDQYKKNPLGLFGKDLVNKSYFYSYDEVFYNALEELIVKVKISPLAINSVFAVDYKQIIDHELLQKGMLLMDFSYRQTSVLVFKKGLLKAHLKVPFGYYHIVNDVAIMLDIEFEKARSLVEDYGNALNLKSNKKQITIIDENADKQFIAIDAINEIISARLNETIELIERELRQYQIFSDFKDGIYITGTGIKLRYFTNLLRIRFGLNVFNFSSLLNEHILKKNIKVNEEEFDLLKAHLISFIKTNYTKSDSLALTKNRFSRWFQLSMDGLFK